MLDINMDGAESLMDDTWSRGSRAPMSTLSLTRKSKKTSPTQETVTEQIALPIDIETGEEIEMINRLRNYKNGKAEA